MDPYSSDIIWLLLYLFALFVVLPWAFYVRVVKYRDRLHREHEELLRKRNLERRSSVTSSTQKRPKPKRRTQSSSKSKKKESIPSFQAYNPLYNKILAQANSLENMADHQKQSISVKEIQDSHYDTTKLLQWHQSRGLSQAALSKLGKVKLEPRGEVQNYGGFLFESVRHDIRSMEDRLSGLVIRREAAIKAKNGFAIKPRIKFASYNNEEWNKVRNAAQARDQHTCQICGKNLGAIASEMHVHHLWYSGHPWEVPLEALITLCKEHHEEVHDHPRHILNPQNI